MSYNYDWEWTGYTNLNFSELAMSSMGGVDAAKVSLEAQFMSELPSQTVSEFGKQGYVVSNVTVKSLTVDLEEFSVWNPIQGRYVYAWKLHVSHTVNFDSDKPIMESPLAPAIIAILYKIMEFIIIALAIYFVVQAVADVLKSMVTETHHIIYYDASGNPTQEEWITNPSPTGITTLILMMFLVIILFMFMGKKGVI
jgi:hypothetical protein